jgi:IstB-like ATP binding protein
VKASHAAERSVIAHIDPTSSDVGLIPGHSRNALGGKDMSLEAIVDPTQHAHAGADLIGQGRETQRHAFPGVALGPLRVVPDGRICVSKNAAESAARNRSWKNVVALRGFRSRRASTSASHARGSISPIRHGERGRICPDQAMTQATIDRLVHHATILETNVDSYRRKAAVEKARGATHS